FKEGVYQIAEPALFDGLRAAADKPILFRSAPGAAGKCLFTGEKNVTGWEPLESSDFWKGAPDALKARVRPEALPLIWTAPYAPYESRRYEPGTDGARQELFADGAPQTLARWPNEGFATSGKALGATPLPESEWKPKGTKEGVFETDANQPYGWENEPGGLLFGYWYWDWSESYAKYDAVRREGERQIISIASSDSTYGYKDHLRYYGLNLLCELDAPGEFYVDRAAKQIFWIPAEGVDPKSARVALTTYERPWMIEVSNCAGIIFAGLTLEGGFGGAASVKDSDDILFADVEARRFSGRTAVSISGGSRCGAYHSLLETLGGGGFAMHGGDRKTLTDAKHFLSQCTVRDFSRIFRTYAPAAYLEGCGIQVSHCDFSEASSSAMRIEGNEHLVEYCRFTDLVKESDDQGGIDAWFNPTYRGNVIRYNYWKDIVGGTLCGAAAVRFDDMISGYLVYGNVFIHCGAVNFGAVQIHGGKENRIENNVFLDCRAVVSFTRWGERYTGAFTDPDNQYYGAMQKQCHRDVEIDSPLWRERYPSLARIAEDADVNTIVNNLAVNCRDLFLNPGEVQQTENNTVLEYPDANLAELLSPETLARHGLRPIPVGEMGVTAKPYLDR
ncbi:MAG: right-handed parallel beta-helix repeat-containing protein, partial [Thermoguttaceae bacterium]|nr:right-handed parallel beta-helix repeat-containing protein [Thermoguttaceae bacterium]